MKYVGHIFNKCIYKIYSGLRLPDLSFISSIITVRCSDLGQIYQIVFLKFPRTSVFLVFCRRDYARETILVVY